MANPERSEALPLLPEDLEYIGGVISRWEGLGLETDIEDGELQVVYYPKKRSSDVDGLKLATYSRYQEDLRTDSKREEFYEIEGEVDNAEDPGLFANRLGISPRRPTQESQESLFPQVIAAQVFSPLTEQLCRQPLELAKEKVEKMVKKMDDPVGAFYLAYYFSVNALQKTKDENNGELDWSNGLVQTRWNHRKTFLSEHFFDPDEEIAPLNSLKRWKEEIDRRDFADWFDENLIPWGDLSQLNYSRRDLEVRFPDSEFLAEIIKKLKHWEPKQLAQIIETRGMPLTRRDLNWMANVLGVNVDLEELGLEVWGRENRLYVQDGAGNPKLAASRYYETSFFDDGLMVIGDVLPFAQENGFGQDSQNRLLRRFWQGLLGDKIADFSDLEKFSSSVSGPKGLAGLLEVFGKRPRSSIHALEKIRLQTKLQTLENASREEKWKAVKKVQQDGLRSWLFYQASNPEHLAAFKQEVERLHLQDHLQEVVPFLFGKSPREVIKELQTLPEEELSEEQKEILERGFSFGNGNRR